MSLSLAEHLAWLALLRVRRGGMARFEGGYYHNGRPQGGLLADIVHAYLQDGLLQVGDPDEFGMARLSLTGSGQTEYRSLCRRQRSPTPEQDSSAETAQLPAGRRSSAPRSPTPGSQPNPT